MNIVRIVRIVSSVAPFVLVVAAAGCSDESGGAEGDDGPLECPATEPAAGAECEGEGECTFDAIDACGLARDPIYACEDGSWTFVAENAQACTLECPAARPADGATCDPEADGTHCVYDGVVVGCSADGAWAPR